jgi:hypothetical protein
MCIKDEWELSRSEKEELLRMADPSQLTPGHKSYRTKLLKADELSARAKKAWQTRRRPMRKDAQAYSPDEPAREKLYRQFYLRAKLRLDRQDDVLTYLVQRIDKLQKRIEALEPNENPDP